MLLLNPGARRELIILAGGFVLFESAKQPPIVLDVGVDGTWQSVRINAIRIRPVEVLVAWVVHKSFVQVRAPSNDDAVHGLRLVL